MPHRPAPHVATAPTSARTGHCFAGRGSTAGALRTRIARAGTVIAMACFAVAAVPRAYAATPQADAATPLAGSVRPLTGNATPASELPPSLDVAPEAPPGERFVLKAAESFTWEFADESSPTGSVSVVQLGRIDDAAGGGGVELELDRTRMTARAAVVWISRSPGTVTDAQLVRVALLGDARLEQDGVVRSGPNLYVTGIVRGNIRLAGGSRASRDLASGQTYVVADTLRRVAETPTERLGSAVLARPAGEPVPRREITAEQLRAAPVRFRFQRAQTVPADDGKIAAILTGDIVLFQRRPEGDFLELRASRAVVLTTLTSITETDDAIRSGGATSETISGVYLEGDVRVTFTPGSAGVIGEQRLQADRMFYDFSTDRAVLTDAVLHTVDAERGLPVVMRARTVQQLSQGEYNAEKVELSTSAFAVPTYSVRAGRMYVRQVPSSYEGDRARTLFSGRNLTLNTFGVPIMYFPAAGGDVSNFPLRSIALEDSDRFGFGVRTQWGLYESFGRPHPRDLDIAYRLDYLSRRGPATGIDADYKGGLVTETTAEPWNFEGRVRSYLISDSNSDLFAGRRRDVDPDRDVRGQVLFEHQHFLPEDWQVQLRAGYSSDATFLEQYFQRDFETQLPYELSFYAVRQRDSEQLSLLATTPLNDFPTTADLAQEQTFVQRYPEIAYRRIGDSVLDDRFTLFSDNSLSVLSFRNSTTSLEDQGYNTGTGPGLRSFAQTGLGTDGLPDEATVLRADLRQQLDYPTQLGQFKVVPYVVGRYTPYSDSARGDAENRVYSAAGARFTTAFWRTNDTISSELFDIQRMRHVIEPVVNVYTSGTTTDSSNLLIYDEPVDKLYDVSAAQLRLEQRWQTKRGGPGRWRTVDLFAFNVEGAFFTNDPDPVFTEPDNFRGMYFSSLPEASIPRSAVNADAAWRISDTTSLLADQQYNVDNNSLATVAGGISVRRDPRLSYLIEQRYIDAIARIRTPTGFRDSADRGDRVSSNITSASINYQLSAKYLLQATQSYDFTQTNNVSSSVTVNRRFDRLVVGLTIYTDSVNDETGFRFSLVPEGLIAGNSSSTVSNLIDRRNR